MLDVARESSDWFAQVLTVDNTGAISREAVEIQRREYLRRRGRRCADRAGIFLFLRGCGSGLLLGQADPRGRAGRPDPRCRGESLSAREHRVGYRCRRCDGDLVLPSLFHVPSPVLHAIPALKSFYAEANTFWGKVWALTGRSVTVLWGLFLTGIGTVFQWLDPIAAALGDPDLKAQVMEALEDNPQYLAYVLMGSQPSLSRLGFDRLGRPDRCGRPSLDGS
ncbi:hypothetical protein ACVIHH_005117 [Bradyrhizobium sp. USDA 4518]